MLCFLAERDVKKLHAVFLVEGSLYGYFPLFFGRIVERVVG
jgi:hypothetical protein